MKADIFLFEIDVDLNIAFTQRQPYTPIATSGFGASFTVDEEVCRVASACNDVETTVVHEQRDTVQYPVKHPIEIFITRTLLVLILKCDSPDIDANLGRQAGKRMESRLWQEFFGFCRWLWVDNDGGEPLHPIRYVTLDHDETEFDVDACNWSSCGTAAADKYRWKCAGEWIWSLSWRNDGDDRKLAKSERAQNSPCSEIVSH